MRFQLFILLLGMSFGFSSCEKAGVFASPDAPKGQTSPNTEASPSDFSAQIPELCEKLDSSIQAYQWKLKTCEGIHWHAERLSEEGRPLIYAEFGEPTNPNKTLIFSMVHPDEITPLYVGFKLVHYMREHELLLKNAHVIIAPLLNPDGHFRKPPIRVNSRGVDLNRNFDTPLWRAKALKEWESKLKKNPRRFPGDEPSSESETKFQIEMIEKFKPSKILSIHAPLNVTDYDGPNSLTLDRFPKEYVHACYQLRNRLKAKSTGFFPGSLGNYAGIDKGIPTITLELPSASPRAADFYWKKFQPGIRSMIDFKFQK